MSEDQSTAPVLDAIQRYRDRGDINFTPPGHRNGGPAEQIPAKDAIGRICAEMISPYPPGIPVVAPGERITRPVMDYLATGAAAGFLIPDAADPSMETVRVVEE